MLLDELTSAPRRGCDWRLQLPLFACCLALLPGAWAQMPNPNSVDLVSVEADSDGIPGVTVRFDVERRVSDGWRAVASGESLPPAAEVRLCVRASRSGTIQIWNFRYGDDGEPVSEGKKPLIPYGQDELEDGSPVAAEFFDDQVEAEVRRCVGDGAQTFRANSAEGRWGFWLKFEDGGGGTAGGEDTPVLVAGDYLTFKSGFKKPRTNRYVSRFVSYRVD